ncbi:MAG: BLUF domain-containing protein [Bacteroidia bacterium]|nr:BLUF domain-containing protein [Bacteroidia bacterium]NND25581.1 hypothetical protein [Flavobacteriaceae bacterium]NNK59683.1 hypothetical protein [Flavobacteriaceae bacterium]NNL33469.1 hypothetical protein [Flavobacteriaceae bacterium]
MIEVSKKIITDLFGRIFVDNRHKNVLTLYDDPIEDRIFESYEARFTVIKPKDQILKQRLYFDWIKISDIASVNKLINLASTFITK